MSSIAGIVVTVLGLIAIMIGLYFVRFPGLCAPDESHVACIRSWLSAVGPIIAILALCVALAQFQLAQNATSRQLRAYVSAVPVINAANELSILCENQGQTPAYKLTVHANWYHVPHAQTLAPDFDFRDYGSAIPTPSTLQIKGAAKVSIPQFDRAVLDRVLRNEIALFIYGHADYEDTFGSTHRTNFAFQYFPVMENGQRVGHALHMIARHNGAD